MPVIASAVRSLTCVIGLCLVQMSYAQSDSPSCKKYLALSKQPQPVPWSEFKRVLEIPDVADGCRHARSTNVTADFNQKVGAARLSATITPRANSCVVSNIKVSGC